LDKWCRGEESNLYSRGRPIYSRRGSPLPSLDISWRTAEESNPCPCGPRRLSKPDALRCAGPSRRDAGGIRTHVTTGFAGPRLAIGIGAKLVPPVGFEPTLLSETGSEPAASASSSHRGKLAEGAGVEPTRLALARLATGCRRRLSACPSVSGGPGGTRTLKPPGCKPGALPVGATSP
jgi:hypothetical protein